MTAPHHGGDLTAAARLFGTPPDGWLDLSTGINPAAYPAAVEAGALRRLPDSGQLDALRAAAAGAYGLAEPARIAAAPGTQALIQWLPRLRPAGRVAVLSPTYGEHAPAWRLAGHEVVETGCLAAADDADVVVVTRPNNPDGAIVPRAELAALAGRLAAAGGLLVVDEAFADADPAASVAADIGAGVVALRSFGKFYGLPGLRLGFALSDPATAADIARALGPWPVSTVAAGIGAAALADEAWREAMRTTLAAAAERLDALIAGAGLEAVGGTTLFRLAAGDHAPTLFRRLGEAGIYVRHFPERPDWLRFGLPGTEADWTRLQAALRP